MTLGQLKAALRAGTEPDALPGFRILGRGTYRAAYSDGTFVVKSQRGNWQHTSPKQARATSITRAKVRDIPPAARARVAPTVYVRVENSQAGECAYAIQLLYPPLAVPETRSTAVARIEWSDRVNAAVLKLSREERSAMGTMTDNHAGNFGRDKRGRLVCFDW
jgi:hypothetical protein